jgi:antitoxin CcdA
MKMEAIKAVRRKPVNLSLDTGVVEAAREAGINLSKACEAALREATRVECDRRWKEENREALQSWGDWIEKNGSPLDRHRAF